MFRNASKSLFRGSNTGSSTIASLCSSILAMASWRRLPAVDKTSECRPKLLRIVSCRLFLDGLTPARTADPTADPSSASRGDRAGERAAGDCDGPAGVRRVGDRPGESDARLLSILPSIFRFVYRECSTELSAKTSPGSRGIDCASFRASVVPCAAAVGEGERLGERWGLW